MDREDLRFILQEGEGYKIEFKERSGGLDREMTAFANAQGGRIFLGIDDDNRIIGIAVTNRLKSSIRDIARNCDPPIEIHFERVGAVDNVLVVRINEGTDKPYRCSSGFYMRQGPNTQKLTRDQTMDFAIGEGVVRFDEQINHRFKYPTDFSSARLRTYLERIGVRTDTVPEKSLLNLTVAERDAPLLFKNAGVMLFAREPARFISNNKVICARFEGSVKTAGIIDRADYQDDLLSNVDNALQFVRKNTRTAGKIIEFQRIDKTEYPYEAVREAILNAVMHRDYFIENAPVHVNIFDDRIEVISPGSLPKGVTLETLGEMSVPRNNLVTDLVLRTGLIEKLGTGIQRMRNLLIEHGLEEPEFQESPQLFKVTFYGPGEKILELIPDAKGQDLRELGLNERQIQALALLVNAKETMTNRKYRDLFAVSNKTVYRDLDGLLEKGFIEKHGQGRSVYYTAR